MSKNLTALAVAGMLLTAAGGAHASTSQLVFNAPDYPTTLSLDTGGNPFFQCRDAYPTLTCSVDTPYHTGNAVFQGYVDFSYLTSDCVYWFTAHYDIKTGAYEFDDIHTSSYGTSVTCTSTPNAQKQYVVRYVTSDNQ